MNIFSLPTLPTFALNLPDGLPVLADAALKTLALLAVAGLVTTALRRRSAATRHLVWCAALLGALLLPVLSPVLPQWQVSFLPRWPVWAQTPAAMPAGRVVDLNPNVGGVPPPRDGGPNLSRQLATSEPDAGVIPAPAKLAPTPNGNAPSSLNMASSNASALAAPKSDASSSLQVWLTLAWLAGTLLALAPLLAGWWQIARITRRTAPVTDAATMVLLNGLCTQLGLRRTITLRHTREVTMPVTWGAWWPVLLLPDAALTWSPARLRLVLLHELAHIQRWDWTAQFVAHAACAFYWFNPLAWLAARRMRLEREQACDDRVLAAGTAPCDYADELLQIAATLRGPSWLGLATVPMAQHSNLETRLRSILDGKRPRAALTHTARLIALSLATAIIAPLAMLRGSAPVQPEQNPNVNADQEAQARANALVGLNIALGQLERFAGPDQNQPTAYVTAPLVPISVSSTLASDSGNGSITKLEERYVWVVQDDGVKVTAIPNDMDSSKQAANSVLSPGSFNINATSIEAWTKVLTELNQRNSASNPSLYNASTSSSSPTWYRRLTDEEIGALATKLVAEIRARGPFPNLKDFIDRTGIDPASATMPASANYTVTSGQTPAAIPGSLSPTDKPQAIGQLLALDGHAPMTITPAGAMGTTTSQSPATDAEPGDTVIAVVGNHIITFEDLQREVIPSLSTLQKIAHDEQDFYRLLEKLQNDKLSELINRAIGTSGTATQSAASGTGSWTLAGTSSYNGNIIISNGTLVTNTPTVSPTATSPFDVEFREQDIRTVIRELATRFSLNVVIPITLQGKATVRVSGGTWRQALQAVLAPAGYTFFEDGNIIKVIKLGGTGPQTLNFDIPAGATVMLDPKVLESFTGTISLGKSAGTLVIASPNTSNAGSVAASPPNRERMVYVMGEVKNTGPVLFPTEGGLTLTQAINRAGGFTRSARTTMVKLIRTLPDGTKTFSIINVDRLNNPSAKPDDAPRDLPLQPEDEISVPMIVF